MSITRPNLDYTDRDFDSILLRLQGLIQSVFPDWTDFSEANFGNILLEMLAHVGNVINFYQDNQSDESFWPTMNQRISAIRLGRLIGYTLSSAAAATGTERFTIPAAHPAADLNIPIGTTLSTPDPNNPVQFRTTAAGVISAGSTYTDIAIEQAESKLQTFQSSNQPYQELMLGYTPFIDGSLDTAVWDGATLLAGVSAANGDYTRVDSFLGYGPSDRVFIVSVDQEDRAYIEFGSGAIGVIPQGEIQVAYKIGGGSQGIVEAGRITILNDSLAFDDGVVASLSVTNPAATSGGTDRMDIEEARVKAPASLTVLTRTVSKSDFETVATSVAGVARALLVTANEVAGTEENYGILYVVGQGAKLASGKISPATPSSTTLTTIYNKIVNEKPPTVTFSFDVRAVEFLLTSISTRIYVRQGYTPSVVSANVKAALYDLFAAQSAKGVPNELVDFGVNLVDTSISSTYGEVTWSDVFNAIRDADGVRKVDEGVQGLLINGYKKSLQVPLIKFPKLSSIVVYNASSSGEAI